jgi:tetratricopeptide (TPR) repeat protein
MGRLHERFPDDDEAAAFYALALLGACQGERDFPTYMRAAAVAEEVFARNPRHPGALHYLIHAYDEPVHGPLGLRAARLYAEVAPSAPHALHMPSHIFLALGMWDEAVASNEASWRAARDRGHDNLHALWWLAYGYLQQGRYADARGTLETLRGSGGAATASGRRHLAYMAAAYRVDSRRWDDELPAVDRGGLGVDAAAVDLYAEGRRALAGGDAAGARAARDEVGERAVAAGERDGRNARLMERELAALLDVAATAGKNAAAAEAAVASLRAAADEAEALNRDFGPPLPVEPVREVLAEVLLGLARPAEARAEYERAVARTPGRARALLGLARAAAAAGDAETAREAYARLARQWHRADPDLPELAEVRRGAGGAAPTP